MTGCTRHALRQPRNMVLQAAAAGELDVGSCMSASMHDTRCAWTTRDVHWTCHNTADTCTTSAVELARDEHGARDGKDVVAVALALAHLPECGAEEQRHYEDEAHPQRVVLCSKAPACISYRTCSKIYCPFWLLPLLAVLHVTNLRVSVAYAALHTICCEPCSSQQTRESIQRSIPVYRQ
jgi:hypothetical protein